MRDSIFKAVAMPPRLFWAPFLPALANLGLQFPMMFVVMGLWQVNPILFAVPIIVCHFTLVAYGMKEPHLSAMMAAYGPMAGGSKNMNTCKGTKLAP
ncbi:MAG: hypothetical protein KAJ75_02720 [Alphaproteobacteria bacterium]|nr:hypothetical protein [Alphaproteobacteria bacterium]